MDNRASLLIVDDERGPTESLRMVFKSEFDVYTAPGGQEALSILHEQPIDVVTLDLRMPGMPGVEVMEHIKRHDPDIEIIVVTGYASLDSAVRGLRNQVFDYVTKPFDVPQISTLVHRALERRRESLRARRAKDDFLANLSHELRTPLSAIAALAEVMMEERLGPMGNARYLAYAADIRESAVHALGVLGAMIEGAEGAPDPTEHKETDLHEAVGTCLSMMRELANGVSVRLEAHLMPGRPRIAVGHRSLVQMLLNLVSNALKFTPPGGVVRVATRLQSDGELSLSVIDTGSGISREELVRIEAAGPFPAGAGPASRHSGYGLPIVQALARAEGLRVELASVPGQGTTASIIFPRQRHARG